ncbi:MAG: nitrogenase component 1 [Clostridiaceae bacterium]
MKQTASIISTYASDVSGVCSSLYELGGLTVMHDASGCNSTYNTHDEPRWYDMDSMVYLSGLTEMEAIMGDDEKLIGDIVSAANELSPKFIAIAGTPIPMMIGTDFAAVASVVQRRTGIPSFGFSTNGMHSYLSGAGMAYEAFARRMVNPNMKRDSSPAISVNILGITPLDFSVNGSAEAIKEMLTESGFNIISSWAMGSTLEEIKDSGRANVNLVVSYSGLPAAKALYEIFGTPYVVGTPIGAALSKKIMEDLKCSAESGKAVISYEKRDILDSTDMVIVGESIFSESLAFALTDEYSKNVKVLCPLETDTSLMLTGDFAAQDEDDLIPYFKTAKAVIADPLYYPICPESAQFISLPHEAFSGRIYRDDIPNIIGSRFLYWKF